MPGERNRGQSLQFGQLSRCVSITTAGAHEMATTGKLYCSTETVFIQGFNLVGKNGWPGPNALTPVVKDLR